MTGDSETGKRWFYVEDGRRKGPVAAAQLVEMILADQLSEETLVWHSGLDQWVKARSVEEIRHELPPPVPGTEHETEGLAGPRADAEEAGEDEDDDEDGAEGAENREPETGEGEKDRPPKPGGRRRRRHRTRYRLTAGARPRWLVPLIIMVIVVIVVVWYMLRRINEVPPGQIVPMGAVVAACPPAA